MPFPDASVPEPHAEGTRHRGKGYKEFLQLCLKSSAERLPLGQAMCIGQPRFMGLTPPLRPSPKPTR